MQKPFCEATLTNTLAIFSKKKTFDDRENNPSAFAIGHLQMPASLLLLKWHACCCIPLQQAAPSASWSFKQRPAKRPEIGNWASPSRPAELGHEKDDSDSPR
ncbi:MAG: hypothetical protein MUC50_20230, partial [Myxococcota bacterium]|nr:hypothetical protein [Myxococcota bacterium]